MNNWNSSHESILCHIRKILLSLSLTFGLTYLTAETRSIRLLNGHSNIIEDDVQAYYEFIEASGSSNCGPLYDVCG